MKKLMTNVAFEITEALQLLKRKAKYKLLLLLLLLIVIITTMKMTNAHTNYNALTKIKTRKKI